MQKLLVGKMGMSKYKIILSSNSPRRKELLQGLDLDFEVKVIPFSIYNYIYHNSDYI